MREEKIEKELMIKYQNVKTYLNIIGFSYSDFDLVDNRNITRRENLNKLLRSNGV